MSEDFINVIVLMILFVLSIVDVRYRYVNMHIVLLGCMSVTMVRLLYQLSFNDAFIGISIGLGVLIIAAITSQSIGYGDAVVLIFIGWALGFIKTLVILMMCLFLISVGGLFMIFIGRMNKTSRWPMVPWLLISFVIGVGIW